MDRHGAERARRDLERFAELLDRCERLRPQGLGFGELRELARLYRRHSVALSRARERDEDPEAIRTLNALCVRAYTHLAPPSPGGEDAEPTRGRLLEAMAATWRPQLLAWALLTLGVFLGAGLAAQDPRAVHSLMPSGLGYSEERLDLLVSSQEARQAFFERTETPVSQNLLFGSMLFANNTRVGLLAFATGVLAGVPTVLLQVYNGLVVGGLGWVFFQDPWPIEFLAWILPHGVPEFTAICLCASAGLVLGGAVVMPGRRTRGESLRQAMDPAVLLVAGSLPFFLLAAGIESFVRESALATAPRLAVAATMALLVALLLIVAGRAAARVRGPDRSWLLEASGSPTDARRPVAAGQRDSRIAR